MASKSEAMSGAEALEALISSGRMYSPLGCDGSSKPPEVVELGKNHRCVISLLPVEKETGRIYLIKDDEEAKHCLLWSDLEKEESISEATQRIASKAGLSSFEPVGLTSIECYPSIKQQYFRYTIWGHATPDKAGVADLDGFTTGEYEVVRSVSVRDKISVKSAKTGSVKAGSAVAISFVARDSSTGAIRAKLSSPVQGWISLKSGSGIVTVREKEKKQEKQLAGSSSPPSSSQSMGLDGGSQEILAKMRREMEKKIGRGGAKIEIMQTPLDVSGKSPETAASTVANAISSAGQSDQTEEKFCGAGKWFSCEEALEGAPSNIGQINAAKGMGVFSSGSENGEGGSRREVPVVARMPKGKLPHGSPYHIVKLVVVHAEKLLLWERLHGGAKVNWELPVTHLEAGDNLSFSGSRCLRASMGLVGRQEGVLRVEHVGMSSCGLDGTVTTLAQKLEFGTPDQDFKGKPPAHRWMTLEEMSKLPKDSFEAEILSLFKMALEATRLGKEAEELAQSKKDEDKQVVTGAQEIPQNDGPEPSPKSGDAAPGEERVNLTQLIEINAGFF
eukprot:CAMPEP_0184492000 /NCGR_PEP_ID=MMETSP0113_2-20130426/21999_1 /TAXON_ID=91329 /ORGANISM="Norrisiella sphaerica, Strain BC52" /LENGTH=559 /DNA_ID=CAMNT_0026876603 /DNA_START=27 /DNA_END=1706 /DNA_ORIENTATION=+